MRTRPLRLLLTVLCVCTIAVPIFAMPTGAGASTATACGGAPIPKATGGTWTCTFDDEFDGTTLNSANWVPVTTADNGVNGGGACFVNSPNNISVSGGHLDLTARAEAYPFTCPSPKGAFTTQVTAGQVATYGRFAQTYGRFAVEARFPATTVAGLQSSLWMWPQYSAQTGLSGEIDIAEEYSQYADRAIPYLHYSYLPWMVNRPANINIVTNNYCAVANVNAFHQYVVEWTPTRMTVLFDGQTCLIDNLHTYGSSPFNQPFFIALTQSLGLGTNAFQSGSTPLPATTEIDWVRAWK